LVALAAEFPANMELLIQKVIAAGKVPVVPHMPWSDQRIERVPEINAAIDELYTAYPEVLRLMRRSGRKFGARSNGRRKPLEP
jgi:hypothetical protein